MRTTDLFNFNRSSKRLNESLQKTFGARINFESFDTAKLEDARNKLRTQIHTARGQSGFNETIENEALTKAQFMHDAIVAELLDREEHIVDTAPVEESADFDKDEVVKILSRFESDLNEIGGYADLDYNKIMSTLAQEGAEAAVEEVSYSIGDQDGGEVRGVEPYLQDLQDNLDYVLNGADNEDVEEGSRDRRDAYQRDYDSSVSGMSPRDSYAYSQDGGANDESPELDPTDWFIVKDGQMMRVSVYPNQVQQAKAQGFSPSREQAKARADANASKIQGESMNNLKEGEIQQASAIVTAKTMVDRVGRWIEELSGMENETLLQLGDSIRDEMGQEQAKAFIEAVAPAIQSALDNLKTTRDTLSTGVRSLASGESPADMLGAEPQMGDESDMDMAEPDMMNEPDGEDAFAAAEPGAGGMETTGREQRESIERQGRLMKILAG